MRASCKPLISGHTTRTCVPIKMIASKLSARRPAATVRAQEGVTQKEGIAQQNVYLIDGAEYRAPFAAVQQLPDSQQAVIVAAIFATLGLGTFISTSYIVPVLASLFPGLADNSLSVNGPLFGIMFAVVGVTHFKLLSEFETMYPPPGTWGFWYLPGSAEFHVKWTGVAESLGGVGLLLGSVPPIRDAFPGLQPLAALCLFWLMVAVTPSNIFMFTHNAPGVGPKQVLPPAGHAARLVIQIVLLTMLWGIAHPN